MKRIKRPVLKLCYISGIVFLLFSYKSAEKIQTQVAGLQVPDGFTIEQVVAPELLSYPMFASFDDQGRLFVFESTGPNTMGTEQMLKDPTYHIRLLQDTDNDGKFDKSTIYANKLPFPKGGAFFQGSLYVTASPDLLRLKDTNNDGVADEREVVMTGWTLHSNGAALGGPFMGPDGWLYLTDARRGFDITTREGDRLTGKGARIWRCRPDGTGLEWMSGGGFDNSIEIAFMPAGETMGTMTYFTDPKDGYRDAIMHWVEGGVYPKPNAVISEDKLPLTGDLMPVMSKLPRVAPSGLMRYKGTAFGREYANNLFCAEFNTGRIIRYELSQSDATFSATASPFLTSSSPDSHPTDVLQDADGSLLVLLTGGWFIEGCPLSRVAKPNVFGGIYRIRKTGVAPLKDPWGKKLNLEKAPPAVLVRHLEDPGFAVREKSVELLVARGEASVQPLQTALKSKNEDSRIAAVFALYRIGTPGAMMSVRGALSDRSSLVRTAAARVSGLAHDIKAVSRLSEIVKSDQPAVRRQAATALGQIGDKKAVPALLEASAKTNDRFVEHAIISSLTKLRSIELLITALKHSSVQVQRAAVIALDQMKDSPLKKEQMVPFL
ncbi:MAG TPA: PVC-type heme-binding CxxCH protein, partial [Sphingobacteriaceae bacterium]